MTDLAKKPDPVSRDEAIKFLESACRNWEYVSFTLEDVDDVADALTHFVAERAALEREPDEAMVDRVARAIHETRYGYEGRNPNSDPDEDDNAIARAAIAAMKGGPDA